MTRVAPWQKKFLILKRVVWFIRNNMLIILEWLHHNCPSQTAWWNLLIRVKFVRKSTSIIQLATKLFKKMPSSLGDPGNLTLHNRCERIISKLTSPDALYHHSCSPLPEVNCRMLKITQIWQLSTQMTFRK